MDPSTGSNYLEAVVKHLHWVLEVDFSAQVLLCSVKLTGSILTENCNQLVSGVV